MANTLLSRILRRAGVNPDVVPQRRLTGALPSARGPGLPSMLERQGTSLAARSMATGEDLDELLAQAAEQQRARDFATLPTWRQDQDWQKATRGFLRDTLTDPSTYAGLVTGPMGGAAARMLGKSALTARRWRNSAGAAGEIGAISGDAEGAINRVVKGTETLSPQIQELLARSKPEWPRRYVDDPRDTIYQPAYMPGQAQHYGNISSAKSVDRLMRQMEQVRQMQRRLVEPYHGSRLYETVRDDDLPTRRHVQMMFDRGYRSAGLLRSAADPSLKSRNYPGVHFTVTDADLDGNVRWSAMDQQEPFVYPGSGMFDEPKVPRRYAARSDVFRDLPIFSDDGANVPMMNFDATAVFDTKAGYRLSGGRRGSYPNAAQEIGDRYRKFLSSKGEATEGSSLRDVITTRRFQRAPYPAVLYPNVVEGVGSHEDPSSFGRLRNYSQQDMEDYEERLRLGLHNAESMYDPRSIFNPSLSTTRPVGDGIIRYAGGGLVAVGRGFPLRTRPKAVDRIQEILAKQRGGVSADQLRRTLVNQVGMPAVEAWAPRIFNAPADRIITPSAQRLVHPPPLRMMDLRPHSKFTGGYSTEEIEDAAISDLNFGLLDRIVDDPTGEVALDLFKLLDAKPEDYQRYLQVVQNSQPGDGSILAFINDYAIDNPVARAMSEGDAFGALASYYRGAAHPVWYEQLSRTADYIRSSSPDESMDVIPYRWEKLQRIAGQTDDEVYSESGLAIDTRGRGRYGDEISPAGRRFPGIYGSRYDYSHYKRPDVSIAAHVRGSELPVGPNGRSSIFSVEELQSDVPEYIRDQGQPGMITEASKADLQLMKRPHAMMAAGVIEAAARNPRFQQVQFPTSYEIMSVRDQRYKPFYERVYDQEVPEYMNSLAKFFGPEHLHMPTFGGTPYETYFSLKDPEVRQHIIDKGLPGYAEGGQVRPTTPSGPALREQLIPIQRQLEQQYGLPPGLLDSIAIAESNYNPRAVGPQTRQGRAQGLYQFMTPTARQLGVDPMDPFQATPAAAAYTKYLMGRFNDPYATLIAWNWGEGNVARKGVDKAPRESRNFATQVLSRIQALNQPAVQPVAQAQPSVVGSTLQPQLPDQDGNHLQLVEADAATLGAVGAAPSSSGSIPAPSTPPAAQFSSTPDASQYIQQLMQLINDPTKAPAVVDQMQGA
ncbi:LT_GEWL domain containing protein [uncultured Caudovirales phage]|uniref:LT_GEWL domain containing protein n=1 Tax=uncultured Caudovirales phage TaxID=2100421 RepID=A0A6J5MDE6_9CAUD|nr:LT_GEWL domain containing protein [uncultured Caudovirales phage]